LRAAPRKAAPSADSRTSRGVRSSSRRPSPPSDLQADRGLRGLHRLRGAGEAAEVRHQHEGLHRLDVERLHGHSFKMNIIKIIYHTVFQ
jgi:hypothetical protein